MTARLRNRGWSRAAASTSSGLSTGRNKATPSHSSLSPGETSGPSERPIFSRRPRSFAGRRDFLHILARHRRGLRIESGESAPRERRVIGRNLRRAKNGVGEFLDRLGLRAVGQGNRPGVRRPILPDDLTLGRDLDESPVPPLTDKGVAVLEPLRARNEVRIEPARSFVAPDGLSRTVWAALGNEVATRRRPLAARSRVLRSNSVSRGPARRC